LFSVPDQLVEPPGLCRNAPGGGNGQSAKCTPLDAVGEGSAYSSGVIVECCGHEWIADEKYPEGRVCLEAQIALQELSNKEARHA